jgi:hypothetical protein
MKGQVKNILDAIITQRSKGDPTLVNTTKAKLILKGVDPDKFTKDTEDDPRILEKVRKIATEFQISI